MKSERKKKVKAKTKEKLNKKGKSMTEAKKEMAQEETVEKDSSIDQLKYFLKEMFQFNANDLDFGIYRIYNLKRKEIEHFIDGKDEHCLEPMIVKALEDVKNIERDAELAKLRIYLSTLNQQDLLTDAIANYDQLKLFIEANRNEHEKHELIKVLNDSTREVSISDEIKDKIYNHILSYFEMYYSNGDFGYNDRSRDLFKVPYEADYDGSDTMFHWKHKGCLYIKSGNSFNAIKFKLKRHDKEFELRLETNEESKDEEVARNNNKDTKLKHYKFNRFEERDGVTKIIFNLSDASTTKADLFKSLFKDVFKSEENLENYLFAEGKPVFKDLTDDYDKVQDGSLKGIGALRVNRKTLLDKVNKNFEKGSKIELLDKGKPTERFSDQTLETLYNIDQKLNSFYIGNDSDYFIHENLQGFLTQEKDRYIKNYILSDLKSILDGKLDNTTIIIAKAFDLVTTRIIEFMSAIEEFQKKLFTMKKKVVESEYCLTIDNIDEKYYEEILKNKAQIAEWEYLFSVKVRSLDELRALPTLVLDTKFFRKEDGTNPFKDKILQEIENLDERTIGLLINSENYQGLIVLLEKYRNQLNSIFIDPPYNTGTDDGFVYKDNFRHSSWLSMMQNRLELAHQLLSSEGIFYMTLDDTEQSRANMLLHTIFGVENFLANIIWWKRSGRNNNAKTFSDVKDFVIAYRRSLKLSSIREPKNLEKVTGYSNPDNDTRGVWTSISYVNPAKKEDRKNLVYKIQNPITLESVEHETNAWKYSKSENERHIRENRLYWGETGNQKYPRLKLFLSDVETMVPMDVWQQSYAGTTDMGSKILYKMFPNKPFNNPKPPLLIEKCFRLMPNVRLISPIHLDFFAGSGTTAHSVINLNKDDEVNGRKYILIEMGKYFDTVTKPRVQKVIYTQHWKEGKPLDNDGSVKHIFKYLVLEQYEDVLDSIEPFHSETPKRLPLKYLYKPELNKINSTLDLSKPFSNKIKYGQPTKEGFVDLVDTYNYLQGYEVKRIKPYTIGKKYYKVVETADTLIVWRDIALGEDDSKAIIEIAEKYSEVTQLEVNYDFSILATLKDKQLQVGERVLQVNIIHTEQFNV